MKILILIKLFIFGIFQKLSGNQETGFETPVLAGLDAIVKYEGKTIGYATNVSFDEDFELQGIRTLGFHGDRDFKSMGYNCNVTVGTFVLQGSVDDALPTPSRQTILKTGTGGSGYSPPESSQEQAFCGHQLFCISGYPS